MMFTLADKGSKAMNIVGPENLSHLVSSMRGYYNRSGPLTLLSLLLR